MSKVSVITGMMLGGMVIGGAVSAQTITAFDLASPVPGNQQYGATVGVEISVNTPIVVTSLGAFDAANATGTAHTLNGTIITTIYSSVNQQAVAGLSTTFTAASPGTLAGGYLFKPTAGVTLPVGNYVVAFTSVNNNDPIGNSTQGAFTPPAYNEGANQITINKTQFRYNTTDFSGLDKYPLFTTPGQLNAGSFRFSANTPEPGTLSLFGGLIVMGSSALIRRRRSARVARLRQA